MKLAYSIRTAVEETSLSKTHLISAINRGELKARRSSVDDEGTPRGKWVILGADLAAFLDALPEG
jgi:hypothetical protein